MRRRLGTLPAATLVLVLASAGALASGPAGADPSAPGTKASAAGAEHRSEQAEAALAKVQALFGGGAARVAAGQEATDATLALRDLKRLAGSLSGADRAAAAAFLARPTDGTTGPFGDPGYSVAEATPVCGTYVCIHYVTTTENAVPLADAGPNAIPNGIPDYVDLALTTMESIHATYVGAGYRAPKSDDSSTNDGGSALTDIYLADVGPNTPPGSGGVYGYCTSDDPNFPDEGPKTYSWYDASAFCVLDNDYSISQFPHLTPEKNLQVTAAHEYFHAVQFAYDYWEDSWLLEATATWAEDEVFNSINDNRQYLASSPLTQPTLSLDSVSGTHEYGDWIFFRHFTERFPTAVGGLPTFVRDIWRKVDGALGGPDQFSMQAVKNTIVARGAKFPAAFSRFGALNRHPKTSYAEGAAYPASPLAGTFGLSGSHRSTGWQFIKLNHLTNAHARVRPASGLTQSDWRVRVNLDAPNTSRGSAATVQVYKQNGSIAVYPITLNTSGDATKVFPFSVKSVKYVEVTMTNGSTRYNCWQQPGWSCFGVPLDQNLRFEIRATAFRA
jgi:hypothetical protein